MKNLRIGVDVGGTNTDAVVVEPGGAVIAEAKAATTPDPIGGIKAAVDAVIGQVDNPESLSKAMLGTTHPANAIIRRRDLDKVGVLRLAAPSSLGVRPSAAWPEDLRQIVIGPSMIVEGGFEYDGSPIAPLDEDAVRRFGAECAGTVSAAAVSCAFSPAVADHELRAAELLAEECGPDMAVSLSHTVGSLGLLERENATILNASLLTVAKRVVDGFRNTMIEAGLDVDSYLTQNDGTLMTVDEADRYPVLTVGSGPTNSMRGACALAGLADALVIDVGGTSTDVGILVDGFPPRLYRRSRGRRRPHQLQDAGSDLNGVGGRHSRPHRRARRQRRYQGRPRLGWLQRHHRFHLHGRQHPDSVRHLARGGSNAGIREPVADPRSRSGHGFCCHRLG